MIKSTRLLGVLKAGVRKSICSLVRLDRSLASQRPSEVRYSNPCIRRSENIKSGAPDEFPALGTKLGVSLTAFLDSFANVSSAMIPEFRPPSFSL